MRNVSPLPPVPLNPNPNFLRRQWPKDAGKYRIGTNTCKKGCFAGSKLKSGNTCLAKCEQGFQSSSSKVAREYTCDAGQLSSSPETLRCVPKVFAYSDRLRVLDPLRTFVLCTQPCNANALDISALARDDFTKGDCEGESALHAWPMSVAQRLRATHLSAQHWPYS